MRILDDLVAAARDGVRERRRVTPLEDLERALESRGNDKPFAEALSRPGLSVIAEFKRRSPSAGEIRPGAGVEEVVCSYERGGAAALSVLTEGPHFGGSLDDLRQARAAASLPILRKDFTVDPYQLYEAAVAGADAVLLIVSVLDDRDLTALLAEARNLDLDCLIEVHDRPELERALALDADVLGINNRNLDSFDVDVQTTHDLLTDVPAGKTVVSESGISEAHQLADLKRIGVDAVLIGETLMRGADPEETLRRLLPAEEGTREHRL
ncbi:MAG: indole-3-glycerol phosphate synthase TrpC [Solirubrobacterales bacterium]